MPRRGMSGNEGLGGTLPQKGRLGEESCSLTPPVCIRRHPPQRWGLINSATGTRHPLPVRTKLSLGLRCQPIYAGTRLFLTPRFLATWNRALPGAGTRLFLTPRFLAAWNRTLCGGILLILVVPQHRGRYRAPGIVKPQAVLLLPLELLRLRAELHSNLLLLAIALADNAQPGFPLVKGANRHTTCIIRHKNSSLYLFCIINSIRLPPHRPPNQRKAPLPGRMVWAWGRAGSCPPGPSASWRAGAANPGSSRTTCRCGR